LARSKTRHTYGNDCEARLEDNRWHQGYRPGHHLHSLPNPMIFDYNTALGRDECAGPEGENERINIRAKILTSGL
jgi:hypothetical protein